MGVEIVGVHHVAIQVDDLEVAIAFYRDVVGLTPIDERPDFEAEGAWFTLGRNELHIGVTSGHTGPPRQHFAVEVPSLADAVAALEFAGVEVRTATTHFEAAGHQAFVRDPAGNLIELNEPVGSRGRSAAR